MKITRLEIERFGAWQQFSQELHPSGLTVFYGPNEAGKTTLLRLIRGVLFGFDADPVAGNATRGRKKVPCDGSLHVEHQGDQYVLRRISSGQDDGQLQISGLPAGTSPTALLAELLAGTDGKLFESVFAVGLPELQQFATLNEAEVARHLYGMTLGPQGQVLVQLPDRIDHELASLLHPQRGDGLLPTLLRRWEEQGKPSQVPRGRREQHRTLRARQQALEGDIATHRERQAGLQQSLRGLAFLERVAGPYRRHQQQLRELAALPDFSRFPADGVQRVERLDAELRAADERLVLVERDVVAMRQTLHAARAWPEIRRHARSVLRLTQLREGLEATAPRGPELEQELRTTRVQADLTLRDLGPGWSVARLEAIDWPTDLETELVEGARQYEAVRDRGRRRQRRYRRASLRCRDRELGVRTELQDLGIPADEIAQPLSQVAPHRQQLQALGRLQLDAAELSYRAVGIEEQLERLRDRAGLPDWVYAILALFWFCGLGLAIAGILSGVSTGWLVGLIYIVLSLFAAGTTWALKQQYEQDLQHEVERLRDVRRQNDARRQELQTELAALVPSAWHSEPGVPWEPAAILSAISDHLARIELAEREWLAIQGQRRQLSQVRAALRGQVRELAHARQQWCQLLQRLGLDEVLSVPEALRQASLVRAARVARLKIDALQRELRDWTLAREMFDRQVRELGRRMQRTWPESQSSDDLVRGWDRELQELLARRREAKQFVGDYRRRAAELKQLRALRQDYDQQRAHLFSLAGVTDRSQFKDRLALMERRRQLQRLADQTGEELQTLVRAEPDLALVESDLDQFEAKSHQQRVRQVQQQLEQLEQQLQTRHEELGTIKAELRVLEADRSESRWRFERVQLEEQIRRALDRYWAATLAQEAVEGISVRFERANQPEMLAEAIPFLQRLTCGKYRHLWTSLSRRRLFVDDDRGQSLPAEVLSGGTREQLFLSIRLAMVRAFARQGLELPMVLDDVTVNFDQQRTEAAAETFLEFAQSGQQVIVFTSHLHFAEMFQRRGFEPVFLPERDADGHPLTSGGSVASTHALGGAGRRAG